MEQIGAVPLVIACAFLAGVGAAMDSDGMVLSDGKVLRRCLQVIVGLSLGLMGGRVSAMESHEYSVLIFNMEQVSCDGRIDYDAWTSLGDRHRGAQGAARRFAFSEPVYVKEGRVLRIYYPCGGRFYEVSGNAQETEMRRRFHEDASAAKDMSIVGGRVRYRGELLNYSAHVYGNGAVWGRRGLDQPHQAFRFGDYLIFLVQARMGFRDDPWDLVLYNLKDGTYAVNRMIGVFPLAYLFRTDEGVPDPRGKGEGATNGVKPFHITHSARDLGSEGCACRHQGARAGTR